MAIFRNGSTSQSRPSTPPVAGQYTRPQQQYFAPLHPQSLGQPVSIPPTNQGDTSLQGFTKVNRALTPGPVAKIVVKIQQARF